MLDVLNIISPLFIIMGMGFLAMRFAWLTEEQLQGLAKFVMRLGLPALVFHAIATRPIGEVFNPTYLLGYGLGSLLAFAVGWSAGRWVRGQDGVAAALSGFGMSMSNTGFIGYPLMVMVIGPAAGVYFAMNVLVENMLILPLTFITAEAAANHGGGMGQTVLKIGKSLVKNPIIMTMLVSLLFAMGVLPVPAVAEKVSGMLASASAPLALFVIGGSLYGLRLRGSLPDISLIALGKLTVFPVLVLLCLWLFGAGREEMFVGALVASAPMASMFPLVCAEFGHHQRGAAALLLATCLSFFTISLVLLLGR